MIAGSGMGALYMLSFIASQVCAFLSFFTSLLSEWQLIHFCLQWRNLKIDQKRQHSSVSSRSGVRQSQYQRVKPSMRTFSRTGFQRSLESTLPRLSSRVLVNSGMSSKLNTCLLSCESLLPLPTGELLLTDPSLFKQSSC